MNDVASASEIVDAVVAAGDPSKAVVSQRFFKTGPGEYGAGDRFVGVRVPDLRKMARELRGLPVGTVRTLLDDELHEVRQLGLFVAVRNFQDAVPPGRAGWVDFYRAAVRDGRVNNWDLVDCSADPLLGAWLAADGGGHGELLDWASHEDLWARRVGIVGTFAFTKAGRSEAVYAVAPLVLDDRRDLIQKAVGWMLREAGKRVGEADLLAFLEANAARMGRTALGYAVERLTPEQRAHYRSL